MNYNPLNIPDFDAGTYKDCQRKRRFTYLHLNPFVETEAIVVKYVEWVVMPNGEYDLILEGGYVENITSLANWFNYTPNGSVTMSQVILGAINAKLNLIP